MPKQKPKSDVHIPVLPNEVLKYLQPGEGEAYLDLTAGYGGHAKEVTARTDAPQRVVLVDRDAQSVAALRKLFGKDAQIFHQDFLSASRQLEEQGKKFDMILADLGTSSLHLNQQDRGFAIKLSGPLDMRMDQRQELTAETIVNQWPQDQIAEILQRLGEEPKAKILANEIVKQRPIRTTDQLATIVAKAWPRGSKIHPATRTFQALRIAVNDELAQLEKSLPLWLDLLSPGGRLVVISFHSLEDRLVKKCFAEQAGDTYDAEFKLLTKKPVTPSFNETVSNPRARSAKLRAVAKIKTNRKG